jgi:DNA-binding Xre family transcriptional regulator
MDKLFKQAEFTDAVKAKMFNEMLAQKKRISLQDFSEQIGISKATLNRVYNGREPDINTFFILCKWMKKPCSKFYNSGGE